MMAYSTCKWFRLFLLVEISNTLKNAISQKGVKLSNLPVTLVSKKTPGRRESELPVHYFIGPKITDLVIIVYDKSMPTATRQSKMNLAFVISAPLPTRCNGHQRRGLCMLADEGAQNQESAQNPESSNGNKETTNSGRGKPLKPKKPERTIRSNASWGFEFYPGFKTKGPGSRPLWDLRPKSFQSDVEDSNVCDSCKGTGTMPCTICNGNAFFSEDGSTVLCPGCKNKFQVTCSVCFGTKKQIELVCVS